MLHKSLIKDGGKKLNNKIVLTTERLKIRHFTLSDTKQVYKMSREEGIKKWLPDQVYKNKEEAEEVLKFLISRYQYIPEINKCPYVFGVELKGDKELIGHVGLSQVDLGVEVGYGIADQYKNKGYATEVLKDFSKWALDDLNLDKLWGIVDQNNIASINVLEKSNYALKDKSKGKYRYVYE
ncbi:MAG: GNAT family N-acetyltransferase [Halanaerobiales bacterium]|nr:GNAT family N-acetyltransferase [Halanaerobiales bacterium]